MNCKDFNVIAGDIIPDGNYTSEDLELFLNTTYFCESGRTYGFIKIKFS